jgi:hypothetical protein
MNNTAKILLIAALLSITAYAQKPKSPVKPKVLTVKTAVKSAAKSAPKIALDEGKLVGKTYTNQTLDFEITFPDNWMVPDKDFEAYMLKQGHDLRLKVPPTITILQTAYKFMPGTTDNAILRVAVEDLRLNPQIKDAVDYFDAMLKSFKTAKTPADFKHSDTQAEKLGEKQFAFLDSSSAETGKKRIYATVKNGYAILFTLTYINDEDVETLRNILSEGNFRLNK